MASEPPKVFISYNRTDRDWAEWIAGAIESAGYEPIIQAWHFRPGENFVLRMQEAAAQTDFTIALLSEAYLKSEYTQPEWAAAFAQDPTGKKRKLIPVRVDACSLTGMLVPIVHIDLIGLGEPDAKRALLDGLKPSGRPAQPSPFPGKRAEPSISTAPFPPSLARLHGVPELPPHYLSREVDLAGLKQKLLAGAANVGITGQSSAVGVQGMGGIGKTVLAAELAHDLEVRQAFRDGIYWLTIRQTPNLLALQNQLFRQLTGSKEMLTIEQEGKDALREALEGRRALIVLDDVWSFDDADAFCVAAPPTRLLITTRSSEALVGLGAEEHRVEVLSPSDALKMLAGWVGDKNSGTLPSEAAEVARECGYLPLALAMIGAMVRLTLGPTAWQGALTRLRRADLGAIKRTFPGYPDPDLLRAIAGSVEALEPTERERWCALACFADEFERAAAAVLWDLPEDQTNETLSSLCNRSMVLYDQVLERYHLHDLTRLFAKKRLANWKNYRGRHAAYFLQYALVHRHPLTALDVVAQDLFAIDEWLEEETQRNPGQSQVTFATTLLRTNESEAALALYLIARLFKRNRKYPEALYRYTICLEFARTKGVRSLEGACLRSIGETYYQIRCNDAAKFEEYLRQALDTLRQGDDVESRRELVFALLVLANHHLDREDDEQAERFARESLQARDTIPTGERKPEFGLANGAVTLVTVYQHRGHFTEAYNLLSRERENLGELEQASLSGQVGCMMRDIRRWPEAEELFDNGEGLYRRLRNYAGVSWVKRCAGELYDLRGQPEQALAYYQEALSICKAKLGGSHVSVAMLELARFHFRKLNTAEGERLWAEYGWLRPKITDADSESKILVAVALAALGKALRDLQRVALAAEVLKEAAELYHSAGNLGGEAYVNQVLAEGLRFSCKKEGWSTI
jgi:tetratricopeptide (TPR) repeat protein